MDILSKLRRACSNLDLRFAFPTITIRKVILFHHSMMPCDLNFLAPSPSPKNPGKVSLESPRKLRSAKDAGSCGGTFFQAKVRLMVSHWWSHKVLLMVQKSGDRHLVCLKKTVNNGRSTTNLNWFSRPDFWTINVSNPQVTADASIAIVTGPLSANCATGSLQSFLTEISQHRCCNASIPVAQYGCFQK